jgi:hypothetical protein
MWKLLFFLPFPPSGGAADLWRAHHSMGWDGHEQLWMKRSLTCLSFNVSLSPPPSCEFDVELRRCISAPKRMSAAARTSMDWIEPCQRSRPEVGFEAVKTHNNMHCCHHNTQGAEEARVCKTEDLSFLCRLKVLLSQSGLFNRGY